MIHAKAETCFHYRKMVRANIETQLEACSAQTPESQQLAR